MKVRKRPAETAGIAGALALVVCRALGVDDADVMMALGVLFASLPAGVTWLVELLRRE